MVVAGVACVGARTPSERMMCWVRVRVRVAACCRHGFSRVCWLFSFFLLGAWVGVGGACLFLAQGVHPRYRPLTLAQGLSCHAGTVQPALAGV